MTDRYKIEEGSESGHCCFQFSIVDTHTPHPVYGSQGVLKDVCETFDKESATLICDALNATTVAKADLLFWEQSVTKAIEGGYFPPEKHEIVEVLANA